MAVIDAYEKVLFNLMKRSEQKAECRRSNTGRAPIIFSVVCEQAVADSLVLPSVATLSRRLIIELAKEKYDRPILYYPLMMQIDQRYLGVSHFPS